MAEPKLEIETSSEDLDKSCDACKEDGETNVAVVYCKTCKQFQCDVCNRMHRRIATLKGHVIVDVNDQSTRNDEFDMQGIDRCEKHNEIGKFYCKTHDQLCCSDCVLGSHLKCGVVELGELTDSNDDNLKQLQTGLQGHLFQSSVVLSTIPRLQTDLRENQENKINEIDRIRDNIIQLFDTFKAEFKSHTNEAIAEISQTLNSTLTTSKQLDDKLRRVESFLNGVAKDGTPVQVWSAIHFYNKQVSQFVPSLKQSMSQLSTLNINHEFHEQLLQFVEMTDKIATMSVETVDAFTPMELSLTTSVNLKATVDAREPFYSGIDVFADGRIIVVDKSYRKCNIMDCQLSVLGQTQLKIPPFDVAVFAMTNVAISHGTAISLYTLNGDNTLSLTRTLQTKASYFSLCALDNDTLVGSTYDCNRPAKRVALTGEEKDFDLPFPIKTYKQRESKTTYIPSLDILVLTDRAADKCYLWNVKEKTSIVVEDERIKEPRGVCATSSGVIFVCSSATLSIVQISPKGKVLGSFQLATYCPYSVAVSRDDKKLLLFKKCERQMKLQLFKLI